MKIYLFNKDISEKHCPLPDLIPFGMHVDLPGMKQSNVRVAFCSHYIPESGFGHLAKSQGFFKLLKKLRPYFIDKFEPDTEIDGAYSRCLKSIELLNDQIKKSQADFNVVVAKNFSEFETGYKEGKTIVLHCLEGAHHLGKHSSAEGDYIKHLNYLKQKGLCILTISHFFQSDICDSGGGIPPSIARLIGYCKPKSTSNGLTSRGKLVVEWCQENGVIVDFVHSTVETRNQVYAIIDNRISAGLRSRPVIFSHSGIREVAGPNMTNEDDRLILPDLKELERIKKYGGVFGLILMNYWTIGIEEDNLLKKDKGINHILDTIKYAFDALGDFDNIAIGTDLDGFSQVPDDVSHIRLLGRLRDAIFNEFGEAATRKICFENALRVLKDGWL